MRTAPGARRLLIGLAAIAVLGIAAIVVRQTSQPARSTPVYEPPVLAGQQLWGACAGGFYARLGESVVLTSSGHCTIEGAVAYADDRTTVRGVFGPSAIDPTCPHPGKTCLASDMNYLVVAEDQIPWGYLNLLDFGSGGYRSIVAGAAPLACGDIRVGDSVEINGRNVNRTGTVTEKGEYLHDEDGGRSFPTATSGTWLRITSGQSSRRPSPTLRRRRVTSWTWPDIYTTENFSSPLRRSS